MKLLLFSDLHCDASAAAGLVQRSRGVDAVVCAGDLASCRRRLSVCIDVLRAITCPVILVPGNNESFDELVDACRGWISARVLHGSGTVVGGVPFFGIGGGIPTTPFGDWSFDFTEQEAAGLLADWSPADRSLAGCPKGSVLVSHSPPKGAVDVDSRRMHLGSTAVRAVIERAQPALVVCGHIHASAGQKATIGPTTILNAGPAGIEWMLD